MACKFVRPIPSVLYLSLHLTCASDTTGPSSATSAIFIIYDIFGFSTQALQGADILAYADQNHQYLVFMPDFFYGKPIAPGTFPPDTEEKKKRLSEFFAGPASPPDTAKKVPELVKKLGEKYTGVKKWGSLGMCWGGKVSRLSNDPIKADADKRYGLDRLIDLSIRNLLYGFRRSSSCYGRSERCQGFHGPCLHTRIW